MGGIGSRHGSAPPNVRGVEHYSKWTLSDVRRAHARCLEAALAAGGSGEEVLAIRSSVLSVGPETALLTNPAVATSGGGREEDLGRERSSFEKRVRRVRESSVSPTVSTSLGRGRRGPPITHASDADLSEGDDPGGRSSHPQREAARQTGTVVSPGKARDTKLPRERAATRSTGRGVDVRHTRHRPQQRPTRAARRSQPTAATTSTQSASNVAAGDESSSASETSSDSESDSPDDDSTDEEGMQAKLSELQRKLIGPRAVKSATAAALAADKRRSERAAHRRARLALETVRMAEKNADEAGLVRLSKIVLNRRQFVSCFMDITQVRGTEFLNLPLEVFDIFAVQSHDKADEERGVAGDLSSSRDAETVSRRRLGGESRAALKNADRIDVMEVLLVLTLFCNAPQTEQLRYLFQLMDEDGSQSMSLDEMVVFLKTITQASFKIGLTSTIPTPVQLLSTAQKMFEEADENGEGTVSLDEFVSWCRNAAASQDFMSRFRESRAPETKERVAKLKSKRDATGTAQRVSTSEMEASLRAKEKLMAQGTKILGEMAEFTTFTIKDLRTLVDGFKEVASEAGELSKEAFGKVISSLHPKLPPEKVEPLYHAFDADGNGSVSFAELVTGLSKLANGSLAEKTSLMFDCLDNGTGRVAARDLLAHLDTTNREFMAATTFAEEMVAQFDSDKDGAIDRLEFQRKLSNSPLLYEAFARSLVPGVAAALLPLQRVSGKPHKHGQSSRFSVDLGTLQRVWAKCQANGLGQRAMTRWRFRALMADEFGVSPQYQPLLNNLFSALDTDHSDSVSYREMMHALSSLAAADDDERAAFLFSLVADQAGDVGHVDKTDLQRLLLSSTLAAEEVAVDVSSVMEKADKNGDGVISLGEFQALVREHPALLDTLNRLFGTHGTDIDADVSPKRRKRSISRAQVAEFKAVSQLLDAAPEEVHLKAGGIGAGNLTRSVSKHEEAFNRMRRMSVATVGKLVKTLKESESRQRSKAEAVARMHLGARGILSDEDGDSELSVAFRTAMGEMTKAAADSEEAARLKREHDRTTGRSPIQRAVKAVNVVSALSDAASAKQRRDGRARVAGRKRAVLPVGAAGQRAVQNLLEQQFHGSVRRQKAGAARFWNATASSVAAKQYGRALQSVMTQQRHQVEKEITRDTDRVVRILRPVDSFAASKGSSSRAKHVRAQTDDDGAFRSTLLLPEREGLKARHDNSVHPSAVPSEALSADASDASARTMHPALTKGAWGGLGNSGSRSTPDAATASTHLGKPQRSEHGASSASLKQLLTPAAQIMNDRRSLVGSLPAVKEQGGHDGANNFAGSSTSGTFSPSNLSTGEGTSRSKSGTRKRQTWKQSSAVPVSDAVDEAKADLRASATSALESGSAVMEAARRKHRFAEVDAALNAEAKRFLTAQAVDHARSMPALEPAGKTMGASPLGQSRHRIGAATTAQSGSAAGMPPIIAESAWSGIAAHRRATRAVKAKHIAVDCKSTATQLSGSASAPTLPATGRGRDWHEPQEAYAPLTEALRSSHLVRVSGNTAARGGAQSVEEWLPAAFKGAGGRRTKEHRRRRRKNRTVLRLPKV